MHGQIDICRIGERLVPRGRRLRTTVPGRERDRLDRLHGDPAFRAHRGQSLELRRVAFVLQLAEVVGEQHRVEREPLERAAVHGRDREPMPGDADEANEPFLAGFDGCLQRATLAQCELPLDDVDEVVQLEQIDVVDTQPLE